MRRLLLAILLCACGSHGPGGPSSGFGLQAPLGLMAVNDSGRVGLLWIGVSGATGYSVRRSTTSGGRWAEIGTATNPVYSDSTAAGGTTYFYVVRAVSGSSSSADSPQASILTLPSPPVLTVSGTSTRLTVSWAPVPGATSYDVSRSPGFSSTFSVLAANTSSPYADSGLPTNTHYQYIVTARNASGGTDSAIFDASTAPFPPAPIVATPFNRRVDLSWLPSSGASSYQLLRGTGAAGPFASIGTTSTPAFADSGVPNGIPAYYIVRARNATSISDDSAAVTATPFREICIADDNSYTVSVYDGDAGGNLAPKRQFGWQTGLAGVAAIAVDPGAGAAGVAFVASPGNLRVNTYPSTVSGNAAPSSTLLLPSPPRALALDSSNGELWVGITGEVRVYSVAATDASLTLKRTLALAVSTDVARAIAVDSGHGEVMVLAGALAIDVYPRTWTTSPARTRTLAVAPFVASTGLQQLVYDATSDGVFTLQISAPSGITSAAIAEYPRAPTTGCSGTPQVCTSVNPMRTPITGTEAATARGIALAGTNLYVSGTPTGQPGGAVYAYSRTASGATAPAQTLNSSSWPLFRPGPLAVDATGMQLWVNYGNAGAQVFSYPFGPCTACDAVPTRMLEGTASGIFEPVAVARDLTNRELVVMNHGPAPQMTVYPLSGSLSAQQTFTGAGTGIDSGSESVDVDELHARYLVANPANATVLVFGRGRGFAPIFTLNGPATTLTGPNQALYDLVSACR